MTRATRPPAEPETTVPEDATAARCPHCDRPFATGRLRDLHLGETHGDRLTDAQRERYEAALDDEADELFVFHLKVVAGIVVLILGFVYLYAFIWTA